MKLIASFLALWLQFAITDATSKDLSALYDQTTLQNLQARYQVSTAKIFEVGVQSYLRSEEKARVGIPRIAVPLQADAPMKGNPLAFYETRDGGTIVLPVLSLKFLDDLCTAYAWLGINGYSLETISDYVAMLRYKEFPDGRYPQPLQALHIPAGALQDKRVDELAFSHFATALTFIMLHEMGHIYIDRSASRPTDSIENEAMADRFALQVMHRSPLQPIGMLVYFLAEAQWASFPASPQDSHPLSGVRLKALASQIDDPGTQSMLVQIGKLVDDPEVRAGFVLSGKSTELAALSPRRAGEMPKGAFAESASPSGQLPFQGRYIGRASQFSDPDRKSFPVETSLRRTGNRVRGEYTFGVGVGTIDGIVSGDTLTFDWKWAGNSGSGLLKLAAQGRGFAGTWGYARSLDNAGKWDGVRQ